MGKNQMGQHQILNDLVIESRINQHWQYSGMDSPEHCYLPDHFKNYPHEISYSYNSRGFRDGEWPNDITRLQESIWCIGDSFTAGLGSPHSHTWPYQLGQTTSKAVVNVSLDGASNQWMARRANDIAREIAPRHIVIMWSFMHRRESEQPGSDENRRQIGDEDGDWSQDIENFQTCIYSVNQLPCKITHVLIPNAYPSAKKLWQDMRLPDWPEIWPGHPDAIPQNILQKLQAHSKTWQWLLRNHACATAMQSIIQEHDIIEVERLDLARDGHHFDIITAQWVADQVTARLVG